MHESIVQLQNTNTKNINLFILQLKRYYVSQQENYKRFV